MENSMNSLSEHAMLSEFINIHRIFAFLDELAKRAIRAKRVHLVRMNTHPTVEILWLSEAKSLSQGNLENFVLEALR